MANDPKQMSISKISGLDRSESVSTSLRAAARKLRFSTSNKSAVYKAVGLRPRPLTQWFRAIFILVTLLVLIVPNVASVVYLCFVASDQYQSETRFTVRTSTPASGKDQFAKVTGIPSAKIVQDTQIVTSYLASYDMLTTLETQINLRSYYDRDDVDYIARLPSDETREGLLAYWKKMAKSEIATPSGVVTIKLKAFSSADAQAILQAVLAKLERVVNDMNLRIWRDVTQVAEDNMNKAASDLKSTREKLQLAQNRSGVFTIASSEQSLSRLITKLEAERLSLQQRYEVNGKEVDKNAPQMRVLAREIASKTEQIDALRGKMTGTSSGPDGGLSSIASDFSQLLLEQEVAEKQFAASVKTLEQVRFSSRQQLMYLDPFVTPTLAEEAEYPKRVLWIFLVFAVSVGSWAIIAASLKTLHTKLT
ncbi:capsule biosynthesis protein [Rhizobium puerariae]|uniref:Capsule biosynthesis protein n=1 Tax=Rhizobium puerariae TaxID=1585791 RepID=A0ABV6ARQ0_9HYPH